MEEISSEIIIKASEGDVSAFEEIYKRFFKFVTNVAFRTVNNLENAEEITQEVFMSIYKNLKSFKFNSSLKTWIYRITVNTSINYSKKMSRHTKGAVEYTDLLDIKDTRNDIREAIDEGNNEKLINSLLLKLNPEQRACIILRSVEQLSYEEISQTLKVPINTVRSRIKRAREAMVSLREEVTQNEM